MLQTSTTIALVALSVAAALCILRMPARQLAARPRVGPRLAAGDHRDGPGGPRRPHGQSLYLDIMVVASLLGFTGTTLVSASWRGGGPVIGRRRPS